MTFPPAGSRGRPPDPRAGGATRGHTSQFYRARPRSGAPSTHPHQSEKRSQPKNGRRSPRFKPFRTRKRTICGAVAIWRTCALVLNAAGATRAEAVAARQAITSFIATSTRARLRADDSPRAGDRSTARRLHEQANEDEYASVPFYMYTSLAFIPRRRNGSCGAAPSPESERSARRWYSAPSARAARLTRGDPNSSLGGIGPRSWSLPSGFKRPRRERASPSSLTSALEASARRRSPGQSRRARCAKSRCAESQS